MKLPEPQDFALFSAWDGYLVAFWLLLVSALMRKLSQLMKLEWTSQNMAVARWAANGARAGSVILAITAWQLFPDRGPGVWGALAICGSVMTYGNAIWMLRKGKPLF